MQKTWQITRHKLSNNTQWHKHVLRVHNVTNKTYKHSQVFETQTRYTREMVDKSFTVMIVIISVTMIVTIVVKLKWGWTLTICMTKEHRPTGSQFAVKWCRDTGNLNKPSLLMWKCNTGSWFSRSRNCSSTCYEAGLKMLSNRLYSTGMGRFTSSQVIL